MGIFLILNKTSLFDFFWESFKSVLHFTLCLVCSMSYIRSIIQRGSEYQTSPVLEWSILENLGIRLPDRLNTDLMKPYYIDLSQRPFAILLPVLNLNARPPCCLNGSKSFENLFGIPMVRPFRPGIQLPDQ